MSLIDTLGRIPKILEANINSLLDRCEDPAKMIDQLLVDYRRNLADVKRDTAEVMANLKMAEKKLAECDEKIAKQEAAARNALKAGNEDDARTLLASKQNLEQTRASLQANYDICAQNAETMKAGYNKLVRDIENLEQRKDAAKAKISLAKAQEQISKTSSLAGSSKLNDSFARYEDMADRKLAQAAAAAELDAQTQTADSLTEKYAGSGDANTSVDDELARMKAELGL